MLDLMTGTKIGAVMMVAAVAADTAAAGIPWLQDAFYGVGALAGAMVIARTLAGKSEVGRLKDEMNVRLAALKASKDEVARELGAVRVELAKLLGQLGK